MRILVLAPGSRGDVQPHVALGRALAERGHAVTLIADPVFSTLATGNGVGFIPAHFDTRAVLAEEQDTFRRIHNPVALLRGLSRRGAEMARAWSDAAIPASRDADLIVAAGGAIYMALSLAETSGRPVVQTMLQPFFPTRAFPSPIVPPRSWPGGINLLSHYAMLWLFQAMFRRSTNLFRSALALGPWPFWQMPSRLSAYRALCAVSPLVVPPPDDLPRAVEITGYWFLDDHSEWKPDGALAEFLAAGEPPVYVGFSSIVDRAAKQTTDLIPCRPRAQWPARHLRHGLGRPCAAGWPQAGIRDRGSTP
jgi:sterol 3beta-glucosyltransferase